MELTIPDPFKKEAEKIVDEVKGEVLNVAHDAAKQAAYVALQEVRAFLENAFNTAPSTPGNLYTAGVKAAISAAVHAIDRELQANFSGYQPAPETTASNA